jgi:GTPase SAR1 family protein
MSTPVDARLARLLEEFVDRDVEMERFQSLLDDETRSILVIWGGGGVGKSSLQGKMIHETARRGLRKAEVIVTESRHKDYLAIMRKIRDDIGVESFRSFTDLVNYFTVAHYQLTIDVKGQRAVSVLDKGKITGAQVGDVAGVMIKDFMISDPRTDMAVPETERMTRLTDVFLDCLADEVAGSPLVVFFDAVEKLGEDTERWVWEELLVAAREGHLGTAKFVLCGRKEPPLDRAWNEAAEVRHLEPLDEEHVEAYLEKRGIPPEGRQQLAVGLLVASEGNMMRLATCVDGYLKHQKRRETE